MALRTLIIGLGAVALVACAGTTTRLDPTRMTDVYVADFTSSEPETCTTADVDLTHKEAHTYFLRASQLSERALSDQYPLAPCRVEGTLRYDGARCDFEISAAMTGAITCGQRRWFFACEDCGELFRP